VPEDPEAWNVPVRGKIESGLLGPAAYGPGTVPVRLAVVPSDQARQLQPARIRHTIVSYIQYVLFVGDLLMLYIKDIYF
jgi:hypothetical protein